MLKVSLWSDHEKVTAIAMLVLTANLCAIAVGSRRKEWIAFPGLGCEVFSRLHSEELRWNKMRDVTKFANEVSFRGDAIAVPVSYVVLKILTAPNMRVSE